MSTDWLHGRGRLGDEAQEGLEALERAVIALHVNVLEALINCHRAATVHPSELERCRTSQGNSALGQQEEGSEVKAVVTVGRGALEASRPVSGGRHD